MSYFKKFGDFCSGFSAFTALIYLFRQFMTFDFGEETLGMIEKLKLFFSKTAQFQNYCMLVLATTFVLSVIGGRVFAKLPYLAIVFCLPPIGVSIYMIRAELISEYPMLYAILGVVALISATVDCITADRRDGGRRCAYAGDVTSLCFSAFCFFVVCINLIF